LQKGNEGEKEIVLDDGSGINIRRRGGAKLKGKGSDRCREGAQSPAGVWDSPRGLEDKKAIAIGKTSLRTKISGSTGNKIWTVKDRDSN